MSYTPTTWATGDVVTAVKLNKLESGVSNFNKGELTIVEFVLTGNYYYANMTAGNIAAAALKGPVMAHIVESDEYNIEERYELVQYFTITSQTNEYFFSFSSGSMYAESSNEYPILSLPK